MNLWRFRHSDRWIRLLRSDTGPARAVFKTLSPFSLLKRYLGIAFLLLAAGRLAVTTLYSFTRDLNDQTLDYSLSSALKFQRTVYSWSQNGLETFEHPPEESFRREPYDFDYVGTFVPISALHMFLFWGTGRDSRVLYAEWAHRVFTTLRLDRAWHAGRIRIQRWTNPRLLVDGEHVVQPFNVSLRLDGMRPRAGPPRKAGSHSNQEAPPLHASNTTSSIELAALSSILPLPTHDSPPGSSASSVPPLPPYNHGRRQAVHKPPLPAWHTSRVPRASPTLQQREVRKPPLPQSELDRRARCALGRNEAANNDLQLVSSVNGLPLPPPYTNGRLSMHKPSLPSWHVDSRPIESSTLPQREMRKPPLPQSELDRLARRALERNEAARSDTRMAPSANGRLSMHKPPLPAWHIDSELAEPSTSQREMRKPPLPQSELDRQARRALGRIEETTRRWESSAGHLGERQGEQDEA